jgi:hypothetical protein
MKKTRKTKEILLKGEGANQHVLHGDFLIDETATEFATLSIKKDSVLKHEQPDGSFAEHQSLQVDKGDWVVAKQIEFQPFKGTISQVWD